MNALQSLTLLDRWNHSKWINKYRIKSNKNKVVFAQTLWVIKK